MAKTEVSRIRASISRIGLFAGGMYEWSVLQLAHAFEQATATGAERSIPELH
jgi:hypothetical protein